MAVKKNPRVVTMARVADIRRRLGALQRLSRDQSTRKIPAEDWRDREPHEYCEATSAYWTEVLRAVHQTRRDLNAIEELAHTERSFWLRQERDQGLSA